MKAYDLIVTLSKLDIDIRWENNQLKVDAPKGVLTPGLIGELKEKKEELIRFLEDETKRRKYLSIKPVEKKDYYELSSAQKRLYILQQMDLKSVAYNIPYTFYPDKDLDTARLEVILNKLITRHESFRTSFQLVDGEPVQKVHDTVTLKIEYDNHGDSVHNTEHPDGAGGMSLDMEELIENFIQPFDLGKAPLLRARLMRTPGKNILVLDMHHIISDGKSLETFREEFQAIYNGEKLPALPLQYKDYARWQTNQEQQEKMAEQEAFWLTELSGELPVLNLPTDYTRPLVQSFIGNIVGFSLTRTESKTLNNIAKKTDTTLYMVILSLYNILLSKLSGQEDIIIGTPISGRRHPDLEGIIGMFVNTLALRNFPSPDKTAKKFLQEIKKRTLDAFVNQEYQFEALVEKLPIKRDVSRNPVFDVMFNLLNQREYRGEGAGIEPVENEEYVHTKGIAKFDMTLTTVVSGEMIYFAFDYCSKLFQPATIERFIRYFRKIISQLGANILQKIADIEILSAEEKEQLLYDFNNTGTPYPGNKIIHELFEEQAVKSPDNTAVVCRAHHVFIESGSREQDLHITYKALNQRANRLGHRLKAMGIKPGTIAALLVERSIDMIVGILAILKTGAAYLPMNPKNPTARTTYLLAESSAQLLLTHRGIARSSVGNIPVLDLEDEKIYTEEEDAKNVENIVNPNDNAYIIYTSGSTGKPKGVIISHGNFSPVLHWGMAYFGFSPHYRVVQNLSYFFDWSVSEIFLTLCSGAQLIMVEERIILDPAEYIDFLNRNHITMLNITPTHFLSLLAVNRHFVSLKFLCVGAEKLTLDTVERSYRLIHPDCRVFNLYGPTETTITTTIFEPGKTGGENYKKLSSVPIGGPVANTTLLVLDKNLKLCPVHVQGELYIGGESLAPGYLNDVEKTGESFIKNTFKEIPGPYLYKTGDRVCWLADGNLEFFGRLDHQVKIRGYRIELGEIENQLLNHAEIKEVLVMAREDSRGEKYLCAYIVTEGGAPDPGTLRAYLSNILPDYMIPSYFVSLEKMPLNPNGKVDRKALPEPGQAAGEDYIAPGDDTERKLIALWADVLNIDQKVIGSNANFFESGGHSLKATALVSRIHKEFNVNIPLKEIFVLQTINALARYLRNAEQEMFMAIAPLEKREYYPLSSAQKRLYILAQMNLAGTGYNMPVPIFLDKEPAKEKLHNTFNRLIQRHESFRTSFEMVNGEPLQKIHENVKFEIEYQEAGQPLQEQGGGVETNAEIEKMFEDFVRPFDLGKAPLLRARLLITPLPRQNILLVDMHHIISDGISVEILRAEFQAIYDGQELPVLTVQYKDYAYWQNSRRQQQEIKRQQTYWLNQFPGEVPILELPTDYPRPVVQSFEGNTVSFVLNDAETESINNITGETGTTVYMALVAIYNILLAKSSGQEEIIIGTPVAGRNHSDLEPIIGMFVNTLALRNVPAGDKTVKEFLKEVKENTLNAFENQEYQFEDLVEKLILARDASRNPLFDVMFNFLTPAESSQLSPGLIGKEQYVYRKGMAKFDMTLTAAVLGKQFYIIFDYCIRLFQPATIERFIRYFRKIIRQLGANIHQKIADIEILSPEEKEQLLYDFNNKGTPYPVNKIIHELFEEQAVRSPDNTAVVCRAHHVFIESGLREQDLHITYRVLNQKANQLGHRLKAMGIKPGIIAALLVERSIDMIVGILAILKTGAAYLPLNPKNPAARTKYLLAESSAQMLLTHRGLAGSSVGNIQVLDLEDEKIYNRDKKNLENIVNPNDNAYIIYTSGSTGKPKGVIISHGNFSPVLHWGKAYFDFSPHYRVVQNLSYFFDWSVSEIFLSLCSGAQLFMVEERIILDPPEYVDFINRNKITVLNITPTHFQSLLAVNRHFVSLKFLCIGAEKLTLDLVERSYRLVHPDCRVFNLYGPTEDTITATAFEPDKSGRENYKNLSSIPIGRPVGNTSLLVLDKNLKLCPVHVQGELYIGGDSLASGYLNDVEKTHKSFIKNTFEKISGQYLYKTGDRVCWLADGNLEFFGRLDHQVKVRGYRIELGEIENQLLNHAEIKEVLVMARKDSQGEKYLCAYIVAERSGQEAADTANIPDSVVLRDYLSNILPDYMIPSYFVFLEKMPLTPNGKVDRKALPEPELAAGEDYIAPGDDIERKLIALWADVLNIDQKVIGSNANFFESGGHSLKATALISRIQKELNVSIPLTEIFKNSTIRGLAEYIRYQKGVVTDEYIPSNRSLLVKLKASGNQEPFFCIHAATGLINPYRELARLVHPNRPLYGLQHPGLDGNCEPYTSIESMAAMYTAIIRDVQPVGPYFIGGWSFGGTVALEIAQNLIHEHHQVKLLVIIDTPVPPLVVYEDNAEMLSHLASILTKNLLSDFHVSARKLRELSPENQIDYFLDRLKEVLKGKKAKERRISQLKNIVQVYQVCSNALKMYKPLKYPDRILLFRAREVDKAAPESLFDWSPMSTKPVITREISGSHFTMMGQPNIQELARELNYYLH
jgi:tyrocidine synthetase-3